MKLERAVTEADANLKQRRTAVDTAATKAVDTANTHRTVTADLRAAEGRHRNATHAREGAHTRARDATVAFNRAVKSLTESFAKRVAAIEFPGFPTAQDVEDVRAAAKGLPAGVKHRDSVRALQRDRHLSGYASTDISVQPLFIRR